jgi:myo-inositol-1(or 4)-monophosphatase
VSDLVTEIDRSAERAIVDAIVAARPDDAILGEEGGDHRSGTSGVRWLIDPIDGTVNFLYALPQYAVSVAAERDGAVVAGVVHNPATGETYRAAAGAGAWLDAPGRPAHRLAVTGCAELSQALVATGFGYAAAARARQAAVAARLLPRVRDIRRLGAASLDLCYLAAGRIDAYYEQGLHAWDYAAGGLIAAEAGAVRTGLRDRPAGDDLYCAAGPTLAPLFFALLEEAGAAQM